MSLSEGVHVTTVNDMITRYPKLKGIDSIMSLYLYSVPGC